MRMWCFWPELPSLLKFHELMVEIMLVNGGQDKGGRKLVSWVMDAGVKREAIEAGFGTWCYSAPEDRRRHTLPTHGPPPPRLRHLQHH
ncbi:hypothetical protein B0T09DRAFT_342240, partial [Sordaria sp. MPI-SDFR-AT-0083]